jgi:hypothetical protein
MVMQDILKVGSGAFAWVIDMRHYWEDDEKWETYYEQLGTQNIVFNPDYTAAQQQLVQGEFGVQPVCYLDFIAPAIEQGAPVQWIGVDPVIVVQFTVRSGADPRGGAVPGAGQERRRGAPDPRARQSKIC